MISQPRQSHIPAPIAIQAESSVGLELLKVNVQSAASPPMIEIGVRVRAGKLAEVTAQHCLTIEQAEEFVTRLQELIAEARR